MITTTISHYRILRRLGEGGMGEVYEVEDSKLGRRVALKLLPKHFAAIGDRRERFEREARTVAGLNHPSIVTIHSVEEADGLPFLTMELVEGKTLAESIPAHGLPLDRFLKIAIPLADAVAAAHQQGVLHRDLKPANVMITTDGRVKVLDFGLAKLKEEAATAAAGSLPTQELTGEGKILGTVAYMSPNRRRAKPSTSARTSSRLALSFMKWRRERVRSEGTRRSRSLRRFCGMAPGRLPKSVPIFRGISRASSSTR